MMNFWFVINFLCALKSKNKKALADIYFLPVSFSSLILLQKPVCLRPFYFNSISCKLIFWGTKSIPERWYMISILLLFSSLGFKKKIKLMKSIVIIFFSCDFFLDLIMNLVAQNIFIVRVHWYSNEHLPEPNVLIIAYTNDAINSRNQRELAVISSLHV